MSIEIKELVVKFNVTERSGQATNNKTELSSINYKKLVKDCTDNVLRELKFRIER